MLLQGICLSWYGLFQSWKDPVQVQKKLNGAITTEILLLLKDVERQTSTSYLAIFTLNSEETSLDSTEVLTHTHFESVSESNGPHHRSCGSISLHTWKNWSRSRSSGRLFPPPPRWRMHWCCLFMSTGKRRIPTKDENTGTSRFIRIPR